MNGEIARAIYRGVQVSLTPDCYPNRETVKEMVEKIDGPGFWRG